MLLIYFLAGLIALAGGFIGHQHLVRMESLTRTVLLNTLAVTLLIFTILMGGYLTGYFPHEAATTFMIFLYSMIGGFFAGYGIRMLQIRTSIGQTLYVHRSFWIDHAPNIAAILIILYGIYRTSILLDQPVTGIRMSSGLSLIAFGFFAWTVKMVPEFRSKGILFLDKRVPWQQLIAWAWYSENVIRIEYLHKPGKPNEEVRVIQTSIPVEDKKEIETVLRSKMDEYEDERREMLLGPSDERNSVFRS